MHFARISFPALLVLGLAACSSSSSSPPAGPVIDDFQISDTATVGTSTLNGQQVTGYDMKGTISFHDDSVAVSGFLIHLDVPGVATQDEELDLAQPVKQLTNQPFEFVLDQSAPKGKITVSVKLKDTSGAYSSPASHDVTLQ